MGETLPTVSIVVAVYDDAATVEELVRRVRSTLEARGQSFEIVFVDDGSHDRTPEILRHLETEDARIRFFQLTRNFGQAAALACGLFAARGAVVVTLDGDLQNPPEEIPKLLDAIGGGAGVASARRGQRHEGVVRWLGSRAIHWLACRLTGVEIEDYGGNFKAYRRDVLEATKRIWAPGKPFFPLALWLGYEVAEVTAQHEPRRVGQSRYTLFALLRINFDLITSFTTLPLAVLGLVGLGCLGLGAMGIFLCWWTTEVSALATATAFTVFGSGAIFVATGVLGLYIGRIYHRVAGGDPGYVVKSGPHGRQP